MNGLGMKHRAKVRLDTKTDIVKFVKQVTKLKEPVFLTSGIYCVSGKSILGAIYALEWNDLWCESQGDFYHLIKDFIVD